jgi:hypothetical protein
MRRSMPAILTIGQLRTRLMMRLPEGAVIDVPLV